MNNSFKVPEIVITSGSMSEPIDAVRSITNRSTGILSCITANLLLELGFKVHYIHSHDAHKPEPQDGVSFYEVNSVLELQNLLEGEFCNLIKPDIFIHAMAVSDYIVKEIIPMPINNKIDSNNEEITIRLSKAPKIISKVKHKFSSCRLFGFKLMSGVDEKKLYETALKLGKDNKCDYVIANLFENISEHNHKALIIDVNTGKIISEPKTKFEIANSICKLCL